MNGKLKVMTRISPHDDSRPQVLFVRVRMYVAEHVGGRSNSEASLANPSPVLLGVFSALLGWIARKNLSRMKDETLDFCKSTISAVYRA